MPWVLEKPIANQSLLQITSNIPQNRLQYLSFHNSKINWSMETDCVIFFLRWPWRSIGLLLLFIVSCFILYFNLDNRSLGHANWYNLYHQSILAVTSDSLGYSDLLSKMVLVTDHQKYETLRGHEWVLQVKSYIEDHSRYISLTILKKYNSWAITSISLISVFDFS